MKQHLLLAIVLFTVVLAGCKNNEEKTKFTFAADKNEVQIGQEVTITATPDKEKNTGKWKVTVTQEKGEALTDGMLTSGEKEKIYDSSSTKTAKYKFGQAGKYKLKCEPVEGAEGETKEIIITVNSAASSNEA